MRPERGNRRRTRQETQEAVGRKNEDAQRRREVGEVAKKETSAKGRRATRNSARKNGREANGVKPSWRRCEWGWGGVEGGGKGALAFVGVLETVACEIFSGEATFVRRKRW